MRLVERRVGGSRGGGCLLTPAGERLLTAYRDYRKMLDREMLALWRRIGFRPSKRASARLS
jgi:molybdate transport repressor ModE-like protein